MTLNDLERQNRGFYRFFWRFQAATQAYIIHKVAPRTKLSLWDLDREFGICKLT